jgi:hypothetical protein
LRNKLAFVFIHGTGPATNRAMRRTYWMLLVGFAGLVLVGRWYWTERPANFQANVAEIRTATGTRDVMTVEAITEEGDGLTGRHVMIPRARLSRVEGERSFWVSGEEGDALLVVIGRSSRLENGKVSLAVGHRVSIEGILHRSADRAQLVGIDLSQMGDPPVYLLASNVTRNQH